jgi:hypothetical protein
MQALAQLLPFVQVRRGVDVFAQRVGLSVPTWRSYARRGLGQVEVEAE